MTTTKAKRLAEQYGRDFWYDKHYHSWVIMPLQDDGTEAVYIAASHLADMTEETFLIYLTEKTA